MKQESVLSLDSERPALVEGRDRQGAFVILCDHASNRFPMGYSEVSEYQSLAAEHVAWDPGALLVARKMAGMLDAPLVYSNISRLLIDCNRAYDAPDLIPSKTERGLVKANARISDAERKKRLNDFHAPFHDLIESILELRSEDICVVSIHSFVREYAGATRNYEVGILHDADRRLGTSFLDAVRPNSEYGFRENEPYSPDDGVYYTLNRHAQAHGRPCAMVEIRNDLIATEESCQHWAEIMYENFKKAQKTLKPIRLIGS